MRVCRGAPAVWDASTSYEVEDTKEDTHEVRRGPDARWLC